MIIGLCWRFNVHRIHLLHPFVSTYIYYLCNGQLASSVPFHKLPDSCNLSVHFSLISHLHANSLLFLREGREMKAIEKERRYHQVGNTPPNPFNSSYLSSLRLTHALLDHQTPTSLPTSMAPRVLDPPRLHQCWDTAPSNMFDKSIHSSEFHSNGSHIMFVWGFEILLLEIGYLIPSYVHSAFSSFFFPRRGWMINAVRRPAQICV